MPNPTNEFLAPGVIPEEHVLLGVKDPLSLFVLNTLLTRDLHSYENA